MAPRPSDGAHGGDRRDTTARSRPRRARVADRGDPPPAPTPHCDRRPRRRRQDHLRRRPCPLARDVANPVIRATIDGFHRPLAERHAPWLTLAGRLLPRHVRPGALRRHLLDPLGPGGTRAFPPGRLRRRVGRTGAVRCRHCETAPPTQSSSSTVSSSSGQSSRTHGTTASTSTAPKPRSSGAPRCGGIDGICGRRGRALPRALSPGAAPLPRRSRPAGTCGRHHPQREPGRARLCVCSADLSRRRSPVAGALVVLPSATVNHARTAAPITPGSNPFRARRAYAFACRLRGSDFPEESGLLSGEEPLSRRGVRGARRGPLPRPRRHLRRERIVAGRRCLPARERRLDVLPGNPLAPELVAEGPCRAGPRLDPATRPTPARTPGRRGTRTRTAARSPPPRGPVGIRRRPAPSGPPPPTGVAPRGAVPPPRAPRRCPSRPRAARAAPPPPPAPHRPSSDLPPRADPSSAPRTWERRGPAARAFPISRRRSPARAGPGRRIPIPPLRSPRRGSPQSPSRRGSSLRCRPRQDRSRGGSSSPPRDPGRAASRRR